MPQSQIPPGRHAPVRPDWLARRQEEAIEPQLPIVDPHHHLWDRPGNRYLFSELLEDVGSGHDIVATCFEECREMYRAEAPQELRSLGETEFVNGVAAMSASGKYGKTRCIAGIIGNVDLRIGSRAKGILEQHLAVSGGRFKGIRNGATRHADPGLEIYCSGAPRGLYRDPNFREGLAALAALGLSFDAWLFQTQLDDAADLARAFPGATIVLNHVGGPLAIGPYAGKRDEAFTAWKRGIGAVAAASPNTYVKLGGLGMKLSGFTFFEDALPPSSQDLERAWRPYIEASIEAFGTERAMFESNFPVDKGMCSYPVLWNAFKRIAARYSAAEKTALFSGAATKAYRLQL
jgi:L-fuconolactonase